MAYIRYEFEIDEGKYSDYDKVRRNFIGEKLSKTDMCAALDMCYFPTKSTKLWTLLIRYEIILRFGKAAGTYYMMPKELPSYARFKSIEQEFYNGATKPSNKKAKPMEKEIGRTALTEDFCINFLKKRNYIVFKVEPDFNALAQVINPEFLLQNSKAELK